MDTTIKNDNRWLAGIISGVSAKKHILQFKQHKNGSWEFSFTLRQVEINYKLIKFIQDKIGAGTRTRIKHEKNDYCEYRLKDCQDLLETLQPLVDENCFLTGQSFISAYYFCQALKIQVLSLPLAIHTPDANEKNEKIQVIYQNMLHDLNMFKNNQLTEIKVKHVLFSNNEQKIKDYFEKNCTIDWLGGYLSMKRFVNIRNSQRTKNSILSFIIKIDMKNLSVNLRNFISIFLTNKPLDTPNLRNQTSLQVNNLPDLLRIDETIRKVQFDDISNQVPIIGMNGEAYYIWSEALRENTNNRITLYYELKEVFKSQTTTLAYKKSIKTKETKKFKLVDQQNLKILKQQLDDLYLLKMRVLPIK
jgi:hypothetical protein